MYPFLHRGECSGVARGQWGQLPRRTKQRQKLLLDQ